VRTADTPHLKHRSRLGLSFARVQEIVATVKEKFGGQGEHGARRGHRRDLGETLEVCVFGSAGDRAQDEGAAARRPNEIRSAAAGQIRKASRRNRHPRRRQGGATTRAARAEGEPAGPPSASREGRAVRPPVVPEQTELVFTVRRTFFADATPSWTDRTWISRLPAPAHPHPVVMHLPGVPPGYPEN